MSNLILGLDGGGTKTIAWLAPLNDTSDVVLGRGEAGPGNPRAVGFEAAQANIEAAIEAAFRDAGLPRSPAAAACFGLAGAGREAEQRPITEWAATRRIASVIRVTGDAEPILAAASSTDCGIALIGGTGSFAWGRNSAGQTARCGGWGYLIGDEGSGYAIARAALVAALRAADGRGPETALLDAFLEHFHAASADGLIQHIYAAETTRRDVARLASLVFDLADNDPVAQSIIAAAASDLAELGATLARRLDFAPGEYALALTGGVLLKQSPFREQVLAYLGSYDACPGSIALVESPVAGALALARRCLSGGMPT